MSLDGVFDEFNEEKKADKPVTEKAPEPSEESEIDGDSAPKGADESKDEVEEKEARAPSKAEDADDWFSPAVDVPAEEEAVGDKPADIQPVEEETVAETPSDEIPATETPVDALFEPAEEKPAEDQPAEGEVVVETPTPEAEVATEESEGWFVPAPEEPIPEVAPSEQLDMTALESISVYPIVIPAITPEAMKKQMKLFQSLKASLLDQGKDIASIQNKPFIKRSGWRKFALAFNISDEIVREQKEQQGDEFEWRMWVKVWAPNGRSVVGIGACSSKERDFAHLEHDVYATAHTRAKNRALSDLIGSGEVSWEELRGMT